MGQDLDQLIADCYPRIATSLLSPLLELFQLARRHCDGDLDKFLILMVVALRMMRHRDFARRTPEELLSGGLPVFPGLGTNGRSIAESLGMPKETVRRKVSELVGSGWLERRDGQLYFTAKAYQDLAPVRDQLQRLAASYHDTAEGLCAQAAGVRAA